MTEQIYLKNEVINNKSPHLPTVIELGRRNRATLGFLPKGAFEERAAKGEILGAIDREKGCIGYLLYRCSYDRITIVHLCVDSSYRGKGVAKLLVDYLKQRTQEKYSGIGLSCRRDYGLEKMWSSLGFVPQYDKPGNSKDGKLLTFWWFEHGHQNLFSAAYMQKLESKLCVVLDVNIFFDLSADECIDNEESKLLLADWLAPELELCITDEIFNHINIISYDSERKRQREFANTFTCLRCLSQTLDKLLESLREFLHKKSLLIPELELRNLARSIASHSHVFVTREQRLLDIADEIYENFRMLIIRSSDLLIQLEELRRKPDYQPVRLAGTRLEQVRVQRGQEYLLKNDFHSVKQGETKAEFQQQLQRFLTESEKFECYVIFEKENLPLALVVYGKHKNYELEIPILRIGDNPLSATLVRHLIFKSILRSARERRQFTRITESYLEETVIKAIQEDAFVRVNNGWLKVNLAVAETASQLSTRLTSLASTLGSEYNFCRHIAASLNTESLITDVQASADIEHFLFPAKIIDAEIPTFIIPIQPRWAKDLFDEELANQTLFGAKPELAFNREAVYYRSVQNSGGLKAPCRILWYVSGKQTEGKGKGFSGVEAIRACSRLDEVIIGKPKELYQRFQRLGVYTLSDILKINTDKDGNIMALRFSDIQLFISPVTLKKLQEISSLNLLLISPYKIPQNLFDKVYNLGVFN
ncbi:GNAT family N-acetyltransferase [Scytonema sp. PCC 10023]|uniref:GNAT family N-acetyltransferase n=1 Tax=Scytonema sp. PCC 10023 TaxID=1680591 RepID=UPI0039C6FCE2